jgi:hypothetical protein
MARLLLNIATNSLIREPTVSLHPDKPNPNPMKTIAAKEKAKELHIEYWYLLNDSRIAKQCALIAVDEILSARPLDPNHADWDDCGATHQYWYEAQKDEALEFWNNVKSELQSF